LLRKSATHPALLLSSHKKINKIKKKAALRSKKPFGRSAAFFFFFILFYLFFYGLILSRTGAEGLLICPCKNLLRASQP
jgi:hypothetical protein